MAPNRDVLLVDDEAYAIQSVFYELAARGFAVRHATTVAQAKAEIQRSPPTLAIVDVMLPMGTTDASAAELFATRGGFRSGQVLAQWIKENYPAVKILGLSLSDDASVESWFRKHTAGYLHKSIQTLELLPNTIEAALMPVGSARLPSPFIVHGHDESARRELKDYLQNTLGFPEPTVLHEQPSLGKVILEKFEHHAEESSLVFVLLTPDDAMAAAGEENAGKRRARQNVIFELGFFLGKLGRRSGRVLLLHKGELELPSDIAGLVYIDISNGIAAAGEAIRRELKSVVGTML